MVSPRGDRAGGVAWSADGSGIIATPATAASGRDPEGPGARSIAGRARDNRRMTRSATNVDFIVVGAGIAGALVAAFLAERGPVLVLDARPIRATTRPAARRRSSPKATARRQVRALTRASRAFLERPPAGFAEVPILSPRGAPLVGGERPAAVARRPWQALQSTSTVAELTRRRRRPRVVPVLRARAHRRRRARPGAADIDVHALAPGLPARWRAARRTRRLRRRGPRPRATRPRWHVDAGDVRWVAPVVVDAAGAWGDAVGGAGRRDADRPRPETALGFRLRAARRSRRRLAGGDRRRREWYFKPEAGLLLGSPANADPVAPHDVQPEDMTLRWLSTGSRR